MSNEVIGEKRYLAWEFDRDGALKRQYDALTYYNQHTQVKTATHIVEALKKSPQSILATVEQVYAAVAVLSENNANWLAQNYDVLVNAVKANKVFRSRFTRDYLDDACTDHSANTADQVKPPQSISSPFEQLAYRGRRQIQKFLNDSPQASASFIKLPKVNTSMSPQKLSTWAIKSSETAKLVATDKKLGKKIQREINAVDVAKLINKRPEVVHESLQSYFPATLAYLLENCFEAFKTFWNKPSQVSGGTEAYHYVCKMLFDSLDEAKPIYRPDVIASIKHQPGLFLLLTKHTLPTTQIERITSFIVHAHNPIALLANEIHQDDSKALLSHLIANHAVLFFKLLQQKLKQKAKEGLITKEQAHSLINEMLATQLKTGETFAEALSIAKENEIATYTGNQKQAHESILKIKARFSKAFYENYTSNYVYDDVAREFKLKPQEPVQSPGFLAKLFPGLFGIPKAKMIKQLSSDMASAIKGDYELYEHRLKYQPTWLDKVLHFFGFGRNHTAQNKQSRKLIKQMLPNEKPRFSFLLRDEIFNEPQVRLEINSTYVASPYSVADDSSSTSTILQLVTPQKLISSTLQGFVTPGSVKSAKQGLITPNSIGSAKQGFMTPDSLAAAGQATITPNSIGSTGQAAVTPGSVTSTKQGVLSPTSVMSAQQDVLTPNSVISAQQGALTPTSVTSVHQTIVTPGSNASVLQGILSPVSVHSTRQAILTPSSNRSGIAQDVMTPASTISTQQATATPTSTISVQQGVMTPMSANTNAVQQAVVTPMSTHSTQQGVMTPVSNVSTPAGKGSSSTQTTPAFTLNKASGTKGRRRIPKTPGTPYTEMPNATGTPYKDIPDVDASKENTAGNTVAVVTPTTSLGL